jgi:uncharacterized protein
MMTDTVSSRLPSPCKKVCKLNSSGSSCTSCGRTLNEIAEWGNADAARQHEIIKQSSMRLKSKMPDTI